MSETRERTAFTPGPWGFETLHEHLLVMARYKPLPEFCVADLGPGQPYPSADEQVANAALIASAPELYEALERIAGLSEGLEGMTAQTMMMHGTSPVRLVGQARDIARAALAHARGES